MRIPKVDKELCDVLLWRDGEETYWMLIKTGWVFRVLDGKLAEFIRTFPPQLRLCIENDETGQVVQILPVAH